MRGRSTYQSSASYNYCNVTNDNDDSRTGRPSAEANSRNCNGYEERGRKERWERMQPRGVKKERMRKAAAAVVVAVAVAGVVYLVHQ